ncbi:MFS transporter [Candidatus Bathyarchaeota archaeon]|nr:MFS transporter [Candidatus Bathyarchaeota archaeon]
MEKHAHTVRKGIFLNLSLFQFITFVRRGVFYTFMINYLFDLMQTVTYTTLLGTLNMFGSALGQNLLWGRIADKYRLRTKLVIMGESIAAVAYFLAYIIHKSLLNAQANFAAGLSLIFGLSLLEFFWSMSDVGWAALLTDVTTTKTRGGVVGALNFIASVGRMVGITFAGILYMDSEGFRQGTIFYVVIAMLIITTTTMWITSRSTKEASLKEKDAATEATYPPSKATSESTRIYKWFLASLVIIVIGMTCISQVFLLFLPLENGLNASDPQMSLILTAWTFGGMLASLSSGWLADRFGRVKLLFTGFALGILTPLLYGAASTFETMALVYGLNGVAFWIIQTVGFAFAGDLIPEDKRGRLLSRYNTVMALSWGPAGLLVGGPMADFQIQSLGLPRYTAYANTFYASAAIVTLGTLLFTAKVATSKTKEAKF